MHWCWAWYSKNGKLHTNRGRWKYLNTFRPRLWILIRARRKRLGRPRSSELSTCAGVRKSRRDARPSNADNRKLSGNARRRSVSVSRKLSENGSANVKESNSARESASAKKRLPRSEEHTSELQSRGHLVCRLL